MLAIDMSIFVFPWMCDQSMVSRISKLLRASVPAREQFCYCSPGAPLGLAGVDWKNLQDGAGRRHDSPNQHAIVLTSSAWVPEVVDIPLCLHLSLSQGSLCWITQELDDGGFDVLGNLAAGLPGVA